MLSYDEILADLRPILVEALSVELEEAEASASFFDDLGGESIDLLDLSFRCEKQFGVRVRFEEMFSANDVDVDEDGVLPAKFLRQLKEKFPFLEVDRCGPQPTRKDLQRLFTVGAIAHFLRLLLQEETGTV